MWIVLKVVVLTIALFACYGVAATIVGLEAGPQTPDESHGAGIALLAVCLLNTTVLTYVILRSRWTGWLLAATLALVIYGVTTFMPQIESAVFITRLPPGTLPRLFLMGALIAAAYSVLATLILGKWKADAASPTTNARLIMPTPDWAWRMAIIAVVYVVLYFTFGYFIAWQDPAVRAYYRGTDEGHFFVHMKSVVRETPWLIPFQLLRGMLWALIALPVVRMMKGTRMEAALAVALLFSVVMNSQLLLPNPYMPEQVRMTHLIETASSNFIFGFFVGWITRDLVDAGPVPVAVLSHISERRQESS